MQQCSVLLGSYYKYWSYKCFNPYFLDQPVRIFVNGGNFPTSTYDRKSSGAVKKYKGFLLRSSGTYNWFNQGKKINKYIW